MLIKIQPIVYSVKLCIVLVYLAVLENYLSIALQLEMLVGPQHRYKAERKTSLV